VLLYHEVDLWIELPRGVIVAIRLIDPRNPIPFGMSLQETMTQPAEGSPRRPARIRVPEERLAAEVRDVAGGGVSVVVGPVPELDAAFDELTKAMATGAHATYLGDGTIQPDVVARLFSVAGTFFRAAPWKQVDETQVIRVDIPALGVDAACLSIIGAAGESSGLLLFRSFADYEAFDALPRGPASEDEHPAHEISLLSLSFSPKKDVPAEMLEEISQHRWKVAGAKAYPDFMALDAEHIPHPVTERELRILTACTSAFLAFFATHRDQFATGNQESVRESYIGEDDVIVMLTAPYDEVHSRGTV